MASTNQTTNYGLPIYSQSDKASWVDTNQPFEEIDADLHTAKTTANSASSQATTNAENITDLQGRMTAAEGSLTTLEGTTIPTMQGEIDAAETATGTSYNNSDSGLTATTVQSAIDEVVSNAKPKVLATITGDGSITYAQALHTFFDTLSGLSEDDLRNVVAIEIVSAGTPNVISKVLLNSYQIGAFYHFNQSNVVATSFNSSSMFIRANAADCNLFGATAANAGTISLSDLSASTMPATTTYNLTMKK